MSILVFFFHTSRNSYLLPSSLSTWTTILTWSYPKLDWLHWLILCWFCGLCHCNLLHCFICFHEPFLFLCPFLILLYHVSLFMANNLCFKLAWTNIEFIALAAVAQWDGHYTVIQEVTGSILRAYAWVLGQFPHWGCARSNRVIFFWHINVSLLLSLPLLLSLTIN